MKETCENCLWGLFCKAKSTSYGSCVNSNNISDKDQKEGGRFLISKNSGCPAFKPNHGTNVELRLKLVIAVIQGLLSNPNKIYNERIIATEAIAIADALIKKMNE